MMRKRRYGVFVLLCLIFSSPFLANAKHVEVPTEDVDDLHPLMPLSIALESKDANVGQEVCLKILPENFDNILGMQFTIAFDPTKLQFNTIKNPASSLRIDTEFLEDNFGLPGLGSVPNGRLNFCLGCSRRSRCFH